LTPPQVTDDLAKPERSSSDTRERERDPAFDALAKAGGKNPRALTRSEARLVGVKLTEIIEAEAERLGERLAYRDNGIWLFTRAELANTIHLAGQRYRRLHPEWEITPAAIAGHWSELVAPPPDDHPSLSGPGRPGGGGDDPPALSVEESERAGAEAIRAWKERRTSRVREPESDPGQAGGSEAGPPATGDEEASG
jgi:hypothetical protein